MKVDAQLAPVLKRDMSDPRFLPERSGFYWQVRLQNGATLRSPSLQEALFLPGSPDAEPRSPP